MKYLSIIFIVIISHTTNLFAQTDEQLLKDAIEDACVMPVIPQHTLDYPLQEKLLTRSHIWLLYMNDGKSISAFAHLRSMQEQYSEMPPTE